MPGHMDAGGSGGCLLGSWGGPGWTPSSLWMVSDFGDVALSPSCFQGHLGDSTAESVIRWPHCPCQGLLAPSLLLPATQAWSSQSMCFPSSHPPPQVPRALFLVLISRGQLGSPEMSAKTLRESQASSPDYPQPFQHRAVLSPLLSPTPSNITAYFQSVLRSGAEPSP